MPLLQKGFLVSPTIKQLNCQRWICAYVCRAPVCAGCVIPTQVMSAPGSLYPPPPSSLSIFPPDFMLFSFYMVEINISSQWHKQALFWTLPAHFLLQRNSKMKVSPGTPPPPPPFQCQLGAEFSTCVIYVYTLYQELWIQANICNEEEGTWICKCSYVFIKIISLYILVKSRCVSINLVVIILVNREHTT